MNLVSVMPFPISHSKEIFDFTKAVSPMSVANHILWLRQSQATTPMHIIKLTYLAHGWMLGINDQLLINEPVEAWTYGPVIPSLYHRFRFYGNQNIDIPGSNQEEALTIDQAGIIHAVLNSYEKFTPIQLSGITHQPGTPWDKVQQSAGVGAIIPNRLIQAHYKRLIEENEQS